MAEATRTDKLAMVFPGQGSQTVGMRRAYLEGLVIARRVFAQADDLLGFAIWLLCCQAAWRPCGPREGAGPSPTPTTRVLLVSAAISPLLWTV